MPQEVLARAGEPFELRLKVTNKGKVPLYQLRAVTKSDNRLFSNRELVFGRLMPGETRSWSTTLGICKSENGGKRECALPKNLGWPGRLGKPDKSRIFIRSSEWKC